MNVKNTASTDLVSIVMPAYNCEEFIGTALDSLIQQTYVNWEVNIVDDCSTDNTLDIIASYSRKDERIKYVQLEVNSGAAVARNKSVALAQGKYIAFLDSDDVWFPEKLEKQIAFMSENEYTFTCTAYNKIDENDASLNQVIATSFVRNYDGLLKNCPGNSTVMYDASKLGKFQIPDIRKRNDYLMWINIIKKSGYIYGLNEPLASHRIRTGSISRNKFSLIKYHWHIYRNLEKLSVLKSCYLILHYGMITVFKLRQ